MNNSIYSVEEFIKEFTNLAIKKGGGKVGIDPAQVDELVLKNKSYAKEAVDLFCMAAAAQPGLLQNAIIISASYYNVFQDQSPIQKVYSRAKELGAEDHINRIGFDKT